MSPPPRPIPSPHPPPHVFDIAPKLFVIQRFPSQFGKKPKKKFMFLKFLYVRLVKFSSTSIPVPRPRSRYLHFCYFPNRNCMWFRGFLHNLERNLKKKFMFLKFLYVQLVKFSSTWITGPRPPILIFAFLLLSQPKLCVSFTIWKETLKKIFMFLKFLYVRLVKFCSTWIPVPVPQFWYFHFCYFPNQSCVWFRGFLHNLKRNIKKKIMFVKFLYVRLVKFTSTWIPVPRPPILIFSFLILSQPNLCVIQRFPSQFGKKPKKKSMFLKFLYVQLVKFSSTCGEY